jgi:hypothetical protein
MPDVYEALGALALTSAALWFYIQRRVRSAESAGVGAV